MEIFNVGPMELILIVLLMIILVGPLEMIRLTRRTGALIRKASQSSFWKEISGLERGIRRLPYQLAREAGIEEIEKELREELREGASISLYSHANPTQPEAAPGEVRSSGRSKLRPPAPRGNRPPVVTAPVAAASADAETTDAKTGESVEPAAASTGAKTDGGSVLPSAAGPLSPISRTHPPAEGRAATQQPGKQEVEHRPDLAEDANQE